MTTPRPLTSDGCVLVVLVPAQVAFGFMVAALLGMDGHPSGMLVWLGVMVGVAFGAAVYFFWDGWAVTGSAQVLVGIFFLGVIASWVS